VVELSVMRMTGIVISLGIVFLFFCSYSEAGALSVTDKDIEKADRLGEEFQKQGPWSRQEPQDGLFYGIPQQGKYLTTPESELQDGSGSVLTQYPLCYSPYTGSYEYCYPRGSSYFKSRFRSPAFRSWWRRGRVCPPGYYFMPDEGCYRN